MTPELIEPGSADFYRIERAVELAEIHGPDAPVTLPGRQVRGLLDTLVSIEELKEEADELRGKLRDAEDERDSAERELSLSEDEVARLQGDLEAAKAGNP